MTDLDTLVEEVHDVAAGHQPLDVAVQPLGQAGQQVQRHDHEVLVRLVHVLGVLGVSDGLTKQREVKDSEATI